MSDNPEQKSAQIRLILADYQSELNAIDIETNQEKTRIISAIEAEELEIKSLLEQYRQIKRQKELDEVESSYQNLSEFKQNLLLKIKLESQVTNDEAILSSNQNQASDYEQSQLVVTQSTDIVPPTNLSQPDIFPKNAIVSDISPEPDIPPEPEVAELIQFIEDISPQELVKFYPHDVSKILPSFNLSNTVVRDKVLQRYQKRDLDIYKSLLKLYQKPDLANSNNIPDPDSLSTQDRKYHNFLQINYPSSLPFFWFLINREPDSIRYVVMEFAIDHIIQTNTLDKDPLRQDLTLNLSELLEMNNEAPVSEFLRDLFICFHPQRVSQKPNSRNKYFDYMDRLVTTQSTLQYSDVLLLWNHMKKLGYHVVSSADFSPTLPTQDSQSQNGNGKNIAPPSEHDLL